MVFNNIDNCNPRLCISGKVNRANRIVSTVFRKYLKPFNITNSQLSILFYVTKAKDVNQKKISETLFLEKSTVNRNLDRMIKNGWIQKIGNQHLITSLEGKKLLEKIIPEWGIAMNEIKTILGQDGEGALDLLMNKLTN